jgi:hypothetical protein
MKPIALESYENFGKDYATAIEANAYNAHFERHSTLSLLPIVKGMRVLDAGCGPGVYTTSHESLSQKIRSYRIKLILIEPDYRKISGELSCLINTLVEVFCCIRFIFFFQGIYALSTKRLRFLQRAKGSATLTC